MPKLTRHRIQAGLLGIIIRMRDLFFYRPLPASIHEQWQCRRVPVGTGPEDFVIDNSHDPPRLLISCFNRRQGAGGNIYACNIGERAARKLPRFGEPERLAAFRPHGLDIRQLADRTLLYVIVHDPCDTGKRKENAVAVYRVAGDALYLTEFLEDPDHLWSPNNLSVLANGEIYLTNDARGRWDLYLMRRASEVVRYDPRNRKWETVAAGIRFANGIVADDHQVFVVSTLDNRILAFVRREDGALANPVTLAEVKGGDNLTRSGGALLAAGHHDFLAFLRHKKDAAKPSPVVIRRIDLKTGTNEPIFVDTGETISAATTALVYDDNLYLSQAFDPFILICELPADHPV